MTTAPKETAQAATLPRFPSMLRKMWSGGEVQKWIDENICPQLRAADEPVARDWKAIEAAIDEFLDGYELRLDEGCHTPTEFERFLIDDAISGLLSEKEFLALLGAAPQTEAEAAKARRDTLLSVIGRLNSNPYNLMKSECIDVVREMIDDAYKPLKPDPAVVNSAKGAGDEPDYPPEIWRDDGRQQRGGDVILGIRGSAFAPPTQHRAYTYVEQPGNVAAFRLGDACNEAARASAGDSIDRGPGLLKALQIRGFGVFEFAALAAQPAASAEPWKPLWDDIMAVAESAGTPTAAQMKEWAWRLRRCAALAAHKPDGGDAGQWMPIETATQDGRTLLLGYFNSRGRWRTVRGQWMSKDYIAEYWEDPDDAEPGWFETSVEIDESPNCCRIEPTHWRPLPDPPAVMAQQGQAESQG